MASNGNGIQELERWEQTMRTVPVANVDPRTVKPSDVSFAMGPVLTEEEFKALRASRGKGSISVLRPPKK